MSLKFLQQMADKYNLVYVESESAKNSIYIEFEPNRSNSNYQVAKWNIYDKYYVVFPVCVIRPDGKITTSNNEKTWVRVNYHTFKNGVASLFISQSLPLSETLVVRSESKGINFLSS